MNKIKVTDVFLDHGMLTVLKGSAAELLQQLRDERLSYDAGGLLEMMMVKVDYERNVVMEYIPIIIDVFSVVMMGRSTEVDDGPAEATSSPPVSFNTENVAESVL